MAKCVKGGVAAAFLLFLVLGGGCSSGGSGGGSGIVACDNLPGTWSYTLTQDGNSTCPVLLPGIDFDGDGHIDTTFSSVWTIVVSGGQIHLQSEGDTLDGSLTCDGDNFTVVFSANVDGVIASVTIRGTFESKNEISGTATITGSGPRASCTIHYDLVMNR